MQRYENNFDNSNRIKKYDHYIGLDWSELTMAYARVNNSKKKPVIFERPSNLSSLKKYLKGLSGSKILVIEETTTSHWLFVELRDYVDEIIICDPYRNGLLKDGAQNDKTDARDLCLLLRAGLLKSVYHSCDEIYHLRLFISSYNDLVQAGTRSKNQESALYRSRGFTYKKENFQSDIEHLDFAASLKRTEIVENEAKKKQYLAMMEKIVKSNKTIKHIMSIPGFGLVRSITILAVVVDPLRFPDKYHYYSYCGLVKILKESGGKVYKSSKPRYNREMNKIYSGAAWSSINGKNDITVYYNELKAKGLSDDKSFNSIRRYLAKVTLALMRKNENYLPYSWRNSPEEDQ